MQTIINLQTPEFLSQGLIFFMYLHINIGLPRWLSGKESACQGRRHSRRELALGGEDPWRRKRQPTPVFLPGESHGQPGGLLSIGSQRVGHNWSKWAHVNNERPLSEMAINQEQINGRKWRLRQVVSFSQEMVFWLLLQCLEASWALS